MGKKEGEKNGGDNKVAPAPVPAEKKDDVSVTAVYKIDCGCKGCSKKVKKALRHFNGVEKLEIDCGANKLTVKGTNLDPKAIREKLEKEIKKKFELVSPQPKKDGGGGYKKPEEKKTEKKEEPKKPKELRDELHKETRQPERENLENKENKPQIMELRDQKKGEKTGGDNKVAPAPAPAKKKDDVSVAVVYKINCNCEGCAKEIKKALCHFNGVEKVEIGCGANKLTVKGTNLDPTAIKEKLEKKIEKKFELVSPQPKKDGGSGYKKPEEKKTEKKEEPKKPKELRDELHKETRQPERENLENKENKPQIMELRDQKAGEKNVGDNKVAPAPAPAPVEKKDDVSIAAVYKIDCNCEGCAKEIKKALCHFNGVEKVKIGCGASKLTVNGTNLDPTAIREKLEQEIKKKFELVSPQPKKDGGGGYKKPKEKKIENKEEPKKPKELRDELHKETRQPERENLENKENKPQIMELRDQDGSSQSWYPPSVVSSPNSSRPGTPSSASSSSFSSHRTSDRPQSSSHVSPAEAAGITAVLKDKSVDELQKLLSDKDAFHHFLLSLDQVKIQNNSRDELHKETLQLARENLENEPQIMELRDQCRMIRTTKLAAAQEKLNELERKKEETLKFYSPQSLLQRLQDAMNKTDEESENLNKQLLDGDVDLGTFVQKYKKLRTTYHRRALIHLSAKTSSIG